MNTSKAKVSVAAVSVYAFMIVFMIITFAFPWVFVGSAKEDIIQRSWIGSFAVPMFFSEDGTYFISESPVFGDKWSGKFPQSSMSGKWRVTRDKTNFSKFVLIEGTIEKSLHPALSEFAVGKKWTGQIRREIYVREGFGSVSVESRVIYVLDIFAKNASEPFFTFEQKL